MNEDGELFAIYPDGTTEFIPNTYAAIREAIGDTIDFVRPSPRCGFYVNDNGMLTNQALNMPACLMSSITLYGNVVMTAADPVGEGEDAPPSDEMVAAAEAVSRLWAHLLMDAERKGQSLWLYPNAGTIPPPVITAWPSGDFPFGGDDVD